MEQKTDFISIGVVVKARGIKGELVVTPLTDNLIQFNTLTSIYLSFMGERKNFIVEKAHSIQHKIFLKLENINDRTSAQKLKGALIERKRSDLRKLSKNEYFIFDLIGLKVKKLTGEFVGDLTKVLSLPANDVYVVNRGNHEFLIPAIKDVIKKIDLDKKEMIINPIDGLLE